LQMEAIRKSELYIEIVWSCIKCRYPYCARALTRRASYPLYRYFTRDMAFEAPFGWAFASAKGADEVLQKKEEWKKWLDPTRCDLYFTFIESYFFKHPLLI